MERIRDAVVKARKMRESAEPEKSIESFSRKLSSQQMSEIEYIETKKTSLDPLVLGKNRVITALDEDPRAEVYRQLRSQILSTMKSNDWQTLAITSPGENAGKSLTALNLSIALSKEQNHTVLLVDLDLHSPSIHTTLGIDIDYGISDCINNNIPIEEVLINPGLRRLVILPGRGLKKHSSELLTSPKMSEIMNDIIKRYQSRLIIFDLPPLLRNDDALVFTPKADATLLVIEDGASTEDEIKRCLHLLKDTNLIGSILNKAVS